MADNDKSLSKKTSSLIQIGGLVIGVLAIVITIFFSIRAERTKEMTISNLTKRPLVSIEGSRRSVGLEISIGGNRLDAPWLLSGRLANTGNQPIEERDIEMPARISFSRGKVVGAEIVNRSQLGIFAEATIKGNAIVIDHKLLNPGDWLDFDFMFDGEPDLPTLSFRISGVSQPQNITISPDQKRVHSTIVPLPLPISYLFLTIGSLIGIVITGGSVLILGDTIRGLFRRQNKKSHAPDLEKFFDPKSIIKNLVPASQQSQIVLIALGKERSLDWMDDPEALAKDINTNVPSGLLTSLNLTTDEAAQILRKELRERFKEYLGDHIYEKQLRSKFMKLDTDTLSTAQLRERAISMVRKIGNKEEKFKFDFPGLVVGFLILISGITLVMLLGGTWRTLLGI